MLRSVNGTAKCIPVILFLPVYFFLISSWLGQDFYIITRPKSYFPYLPYLPLWAYFPGRNIPANSTGKYRGWNLPLNLGPRSLRFILLNICCCEATRPNEAKFHVELLWVVRLGFIETIEVYELNLVQIVDWVHEYIPVPEAEVIVWPLSKVTQIYDLYFQTYSQAAGYISQISGKDFLIRGNKNVFMSWRLHGQPRWLSCLYVVKSLKSIFSGTKRPKL